MAFCSSQDPCTAATQGTTSESLGHVSRVKVQRREGVEEEVRFRLLSPPPRITIVTAVKASGPTAAEGSSDLQQTPESELQGIGMMMARMDSLIMRSTIIIILAHLVEPSAFAAYVSVVG